MPLLLPLESVCGDVLPAGRWGAGHLVALASRVLGAGGEGDIT